VSKMSCRRFRKYLMQYVEGVLSDEHVEDLEKHLAVCKSCSEEVKALAGMSRLLLDTEYPAMEPAADLSARVVAEIEKQPSRIFWGSSRIAAWSAAFAGLILCAFLVVNLETNVRKAKTWDYAPSKQVNYRTSELSHSDIRSRKDIGDAKWAPRPLSSVGSMAKTGGKLSDKSGLLPKTPSSTSDSILAVTSSAGKGTSNAATPSGTLARHNAITPGESGARMAAEQATLESEPTGESPRGEGNIAVPSDTAPGPSGVGLAGSAMSQSAPDGSWRVKSQATPGGRQQGLGTPAPVAEPVRQVGESGKQGQDTFDQAAAGKNIPSRDARISDLERKVREHPTSISLLRDLQTAYREAGRAKEEYSVAERLTTLEPDNAEYWFERAQAAERAGMKKTAIACYRRALHLKLPAPKLDVAQSRLRILEDEK